MSLTSFSQRSYEKLESAKKSSPIYIYNNDILGNDKLIPDIKKSKKLIKDISVLKEKSDNKKDDFYNLSEYGVIFVDLTYKLDVKTQSELNEFFGLDSKNRIYFDGYLIGNNKYKIALKSIVEIELIEQNAENGLDRDVLNIWTLKKNERFIEPNKACSLSKNPIE